VFQALEALLAAGVVSGRASDAPQHDARPGHTPTGV
jgi:hypothetical protein